MDNTIDLTEIRRRLTLFLKHYEQARSRADFLEAALGIQTALDKALDAQLDPEQVQGLAFAQKFGTLLPNLAAAWNVAELSELRNRYAHPYTTYGLEQYRSLAAEFAGLALAAWPSLFGGAPPAVAAPQPQPEDDRLLREAALALKAQKQELEASEARVRSLTQQLAAARTAPKKAVVPWGALAWGLLLTLPVALLAGFASRAAAARPTPWPLVIIPALLALALAALAVRYLWRFIRAAGPARVAAGAAIALVLATLALVPFTSRQKGLAARTGDSLERVLAGLEQTVFLLPDWLAGLGGDLSALAASRLAPQAPLVSATSAAPSTPEATAVATAAPAATATAVPPPTATPAPTATPRPQIRAGDQVWVRTEGAPLMGRAAATTNAEIVARFDDGAILTVIGGPEEADGLTWWQVESEAGAGWSAADYLEPVQP